MSKLAATNGPMIQIAINGVEIRGLLHASIVSTSCFSSDSFSLTLAMGIFPLSNVAFWASLPPSYVEISAVGERGPIAQSLISGMIDSIAVDPVRATVAIEGRDLSSSMIDGYRQQDFVNQTASEVVSTLASYHGLIPVVTATSVNVGRYYGDGYTRLSLGQFSRLRSDWDLVVQLARENSFDAFVEGNSLYFQPPVVAGLLPLRVPLQDVKTIRFERALSVASKATARVQSWNSQNMASYSTDGTNDDNNAVPVPSTINDQPFLFSASNLTSQQVADSAERFTAELNRLGIVLHLEMPWDLTLSPRTEIYLDQTNSIFDSNYQIDHVERHFNTISGSSQTIRAVML